MVANSKRRSGVWTGERRRSQGVINDRGPERHFEMLEPRVLLAITWDGSSGDNSWHNPANWDLNRVPNATDDVVIPNVAGSPTIAFTTGTSSVRSVTASERLTISGGTLNITTAASHFALPLTLNGGTLGGAADIFADGGMTWTGGTLAGSGAFLRVAAGTTMTISGATPRTLDGRDLSIAGTVNWSAPDVTLANSAIVTVGSGGTMNIPADAETTIRVSGAGNRVVVSSNGSLHKSGGSRATIEAEFRTLALSAVDVSSGELRLAGGDGVASQTGAFSLSDISSNLSFYGSFDLATGCSITGPGLVHFNRFLDGSASTSNVNIALGHTGVTRIFGGTVVLNAAQTWHNAQLWGGAVEGPAQLTLQGLSALIGGAALRTTNLVLVPNGSSLDIEASGAAIDTTLVVEGSLTHVVGTLTLGPTGAIDVSLGQFNVFNGTLNGSGPNSVLIVGGQFNRWFSAGTYRCNVAVTLLETASINVTIGTLVLAGGGELPRTPISVATNSTLELAGGDFMLVLVSGGPVSVTGGGTLRQSGGALIGTMNLNGFTGTAEFTGGSAGLNLANLGASADFRVAGGDVELFSATGLTARVQVLSGRLRTPSGGATLSRLEMHGGLLEVQGTVFLGLGDIGQAYISNWSAGTIRGVGGMAVFEVFDGEMFVGQPTTKTLESVRFMVMPDAEMMITDTSITLGTGGFLSAEGGVVNASGNVTIIDAGDDNGFIVHGAVNKIGGGTLDVFAPLVADFNFGPLTITSGTVRFRAGLRAYPDAIYFAARFGDWSIGGGQRLVFAGGTFDFHASKRFTGSGTLEQTGGDIASLGTLSMAGSVIASGGTASLSQPSSVGLLQVNGAAWSLHAPLTAGPGGVSVAGGSLTVATAQSWPLLFINATGVVTGAADITLTGAGSFFGGGRLEGAGIVTIAAGASGQILQSTGFTLARRIENLGLLEWTTGSFTMDGGSIINRPTAVFRIFSGGIVSSGPGGGLITNLGTMTNLGATGEARIEVEFNNAGQLDVHRTLEVRPPSGSVVNFADIDLHPGAALRVDNYFDQASSRLQFHVAGTGASEFGRVEVASVATIVGTARAVFINGFSPAAGVTFDLLTAVNGIVGRFSEFAFGSPPGEPGLAPGLKAGDQYLTGTVRMIITSIADFNNSGTVSVQDIFDFLAAYFANSRRADFNGSGALSVQDLFDFLAAYFAGF